MVIVTDGSPSDADLHIRVVHGDETALELVDQRYGGVVMGWVKKKGLPVAEAEAAWNDALLSLWSKAAELRPLGCVKQYLFGVMRNKAADFYRSKDRAVARRDVTDIPAFLISPLHPRSVERPLSWRMEDCLNRLTKDHRTAIDLTVLGGMDIKDAADVMKAQPNTVSQWKRRALHQLEQCLEDHK